MAGLEAVAGVYKLNLPDGRFYIGSSSNIHARVKDHRARLSAGKHGNPYIQNAWNKYRSLEPEIVLICRTQDLIMYEQICIDRLCPELNLSPIAGRVGWSAETKAKMAATRKGYRHTDETKKKMSESRKGRSYGPQSEATKLKKSLVQRGKKKNRKKGMSDKEKARLAVAMKGNTYRVGVGLSAEHKKILSDRLIGNKRTLGRVRPEAERRRISETLKRLAAERRGENGRA